jgi:hypothetical protein
VIAKTDIEKKVKSLFKDAEIDVKVDGKGVKLAIEGVGEELNTLFAKLGDLVSGIAKLTGAKDADVIVSIQGAAYGVEVEIY